MKAKSKFLFISSTSVLLLISTGFYNKNVNHNHALKELGEKKITEIQDSTLDKMRNSMSMATVTGDWVMFPMVSAPSSLILKGDQYQANIYVVAENTKSSVKMYANGSPLELKNGIGLYRATQQTTGEFDVKFQVNIPGEISPLSATARFKVIDPEPVVSLDNIDNVFYVGVDNTISVAVPGIDPKNVSVTASDGYLKSISGGKYIFTIPTRTVNEIILTVNVILRNGSVMKVGSKKIKVYNIPIPVFRAGAIAFDKPIVLSALQAQSTAAAPLENFVYEGLKYTIVSYKFTGIGSSGPKSVNGIGASLAPIKPILSTMKPGEFIMFSEIRAEGPSGIVYLNNVAGILQ
jgi:hypothetical protein